MRREIANVIRRTLAAVLACVVSGLAVPASAEPVPLLSVRLDASGALGVAPGDPDFAISGRVFLGSAGAPALPVVLQINGADAAETRSDAQGRFVFTGIAASFGQGSEYVARAVVRAQRFENSSPNLLLRAGTFDVTIRGSGDGAGVVRSTDGRIQCAIDAAQTAGVCSGSFVAGDTLKVTAAGTDGNRFDGWSDGEAACAGTSACTIVVPFAQRAPLTARFREPGTRQLALGAAHSCAVVAGAARCWGANSRGELGRGAPGQNDPAPRTVQGASTGVVALGAGLHHTCALDISGKVRCWGANDAGQLGDGTTTDRAAPAFVSLGQPARRIAAGDQHACALLQDGVSCWGRNAYGQLGDGSTQTRTSPVTVALPEGLTGSDLRSIALGPFHSCAVTRNGAAWCWGRNDDGQLGDGTTVARSRPVRVLGDSGPLLGVRSMALGELHTCAVTEGGSRCWGSNAWGQLGDGSQTDAERHVAGGPGLQAGITSIASGRFHACGIVGTSVVCWGRNAFGELQIDPDDPTIEDRFHRTVPAATAAPATVEVAGGAGHTCVRASDAIVRCWGKNAETGPGGRLLLTGQLGWACTVRGDVAIRVANGSAAGCPAG